MFESNVLNYILVGVLFLSMIEVLSSKTENRLNWYERVIIAVVWPVTLVIFLLAFLYGILTQLKEYFKNKRNG
jgi:hypothetical protein